MNIPTNIQRILKLSGPMPDAAGHTRYLETLSEQQLVEREASLRNDGQKMDGFWEPRRAMAEAIHG